MIHKIILLFHSVIKHKRGYSCFPLCFSTPYLYLKLKLKLNLKLEPKLKLVSVSCSVAVHLLPPLPPLQPTDPIPLDWFLLAKPSLDVLKLQLGGYHETRIQRLLHLSSEGESKLWWPFTQHGLVEKKDITVIDSRAGSLFSVLKVRDYGAGAARAPDSSDKTLSF